VSTPVYRAPMRAREREDVPAGRGAEHAVGAGVVGIGDGPGERDARRVARLADLPDGAFLWTRVTDGTFRLGRVCGGAVAFDDSPAARAVGIVHVRPARWLERVFERDELPAAVAATFARGGLNLQRTHDAAAEQATAALWSAEAKAD
jgi:hypothetical protein